MATLPVVCIVTAAAKEDADAVWAATGRGTETFTRKLCSADIEDPTPETPAEYYLMSDANASDTDVYEWQRLSNGDLPALPAGVDWGVDGVISAADARAAVDGDNLWVYSVSGNITPENHAAGILIERNLQYVPDPV